MAWVSSISRIGIALPPFVEKFSHGRVLKRSKPNLSRLSKGGIISSNSTNLRFGCDATSDSTSLGK